MVDRHRLRTAFDLGDCRLVRHTSDLQDLTLTLVTLSKHRLDPLGNPRSDTKNTPISPLVVRYSHLSFDSSLGVVTTFPH